MVVTCVGGGADKGEWMVMKLLESDKRSTPKVQVPERMTVEAQRDAPARKRQT